MKTLKRHRIQSVRINQVHGSFSLSTKGGSIWFKPSSQHFLSSLKHHLPHLEKKLIKAKPESLENLQIFFIGKYVYGKTKLIQYKDTYYKILS